MRQTPVGVAAPADKVRPKNKRVISFFTQASLSDQAWLLHSVNINASSRRSLGRNSNEEAFQPGRQNFVFSTGRRGNIPQVGVMVGTILVVNRDNSAAARRVDTLEGRIKDQVIHPCSDRKRLQFLPGFTVQNDNHSAAAGDKQAVRRR